MTREEFEHVYLANYYRLIRFIEKRVPQEGSDVLHDVYTMAVEHETYLNQPKKGVPASVWLWFKVRNRIYKHIKKDLRYKELLHDIQDAIKRHGLDGGDPLGPSMGLPGEPPK